MKVYKKNSDLFEEIEDEVFEQKFEAGEIEVVELEAGKSCEVIFEELKSQGVEVEIHNGIYCKVIKDQYGTSFEAINAIPPVIKYIER